MKRCVGFDADSSRVAVGDARHGARAQRIVVAPAPPGTDPRRSRDRANAVLKGEQSFAVTQEYAIVKNQHPAPPKASFGHLRSRTIHPQDIRVLVVDDDERTRNITVDRLRLNEFPVTAADGIASALESLRQSPVDVVVIDMEMPNPEGDDAQAGLVLLCALSQFSPKPAGVIFAPGDSEEHREAARALGCRGFVTKKRRALRDLPLYVAMAWSVDHPMSAEASGA